MTQTPRCSEYLTSTDRYTSFHPGQCSKPGVVQAQDSAGKLAWFCNRHNPDAVATRRKKQDESTCHKRIYGRYCGQPAVEVEYGYGVCQKHSQAVQEANARLIAAAPSLLEVAKGALGYLEALPVSHRPDETWLKPLRAAIKLAKEGEA